MAVITTLLLIQFIVTSVNGDVYMHNPRGSNNRLNEKGRERNNANRLFDSQNNNRGGYNVGRLYYYSGSKLPIEWTNQHSCGDPNSHCEIILQYMCGRWVRDGTKTRTIPWRPWSCKNLDCNTDTRFGMNEDYNYYRDCRYTERNKGLFTADQNVNNNKGATATRQNPQGTRRGYECPEERDYYPYWRPSPWKDIAVLTNDVSRCPYYKAESENVKSRWACVLPQAYLNKEVMQRKKRIPNNKQDCEAVEYNGEKGKWTEFPSHGLPAPDCRKSIWNSDNHLGDGIGGFPNQYDWIVPNVPANLQGQPCVMRIRYNVSTNDYPGWNTTASANKNRNSNNAANLDIGSNYNLSVSEAKQRGYLFKNNPQIKILSDTTLNQNKLTLRLAINTAQYGRTFQDRSHTFFIYPPASDIGSKKLYNVNVRGKRGNIVQVYPAVEYDFVPNRLNISKEDFVHFQWTGSDTNPRNNDGQGRRGTDRNNAVLLTPQKYPEGTPGAINPKYGHFGRNYPEHIDNILDANKQPAFLGLDRKSLADLAVLSISVTSDELDDAGPYFDLGARKVTSAGTHFYMCTRNNNFSNRSQKGKIVVQDAPQASADIGWGGGSITLSDGKQGIEVKENTVSAVTPISVQEWSVDEGKNYISSQGGLLEQGSDYGSKFIVIYPMKNLTKSGKSFMLKMQTDPGATEKIEIYHSLDAKIWKKVSGVKYDDNDIASFDAHEGGLYVARTEPHAGKISGIVIGVLLAVIIIIVVVIIIRKKPDICSGLSRRFASKI